MKMSMVLNELKAEWTFVDCVQYCIVIHGGDIYKLHIKCICVHTPVHINTHSGCGQICKLLQKGVALLYMVSGCWSFCVNLS